MPETIYSRDAEAPILKLCPSVIGWTRHPTKPHTWLGPGGETYYFPPETPEKVVVVGRK